MRKIILSAALALCMLPLQSNAEAAPQEEPTTVPEQLMDDLQADFELTETQAAAIAGNLAHESGNFRMLKQINGSCYGYPQWCGKRKTQFDKFARAAGGVESYDANYGFLKYELEKYYPEMLGRLRKTDNIDSATRIFMREFLRPNAKKANLPKRISYAKTYLAGDFTGAGCYSEPRLEARNKPAPCPEA